MTNILFRWMVQTIAVWVAAIIVPGVSYDSWQSLLIVALVLGILNSLVKPVLQLISIPFIIVTFGLFLLVINAGVFGLTAWLTPGFHVGGFWSAMGGSLVISIVSMFLGYSGRRRPVVVDDSNRDEGPRRGPPPGTGRIIDV